MVRHGAATQLEVAIGHGISGVAGDRRKLAGDGCSGGIDYSRNAGPAVRGQELGADRGG